MMLGIETATEICSTALVHKGKVVDERSLNEKNIHSEKLLVLIDQMLRDTTVFKKNIEGIAVSIGPGSFTGLRIGLSTAKGLALALDKPLIAVPTLDGVAESFRRMMTKVVPQKFCALIDAKRSEAYFALYSITDEVIRTSEFSISLKNEILREAQLRGVVTKPPKITAASIALLGERRKKEFTVSDFSSLEPLYLRDFVATMTQK
jgi:tRNA threonylcarbamoyladenosine biosynthesis protein TsaB